MKKLDRYIIQKFLGTFFVAILLFGVLAIVVDFSEHIDDFLEKEAPLDLVFSQYYLNFIPHIIFLLFHLFVFISVIFFTSQLAYRSEIIAALASGISFYRILFVPYFICAAILFAIHLFGNHFLVPYSNQNMLDFEANYMKKRNNYITHNIHMQIDTNTYVYAYSYRRQDSSVRKFTVERFKQEQLQSRLTATVAKWKGDLKKWQLTDYTIRQFDGIKETLHKGTRKDTSLLLHPQDFDQNTDYKEALSTPKLISFIDKEKLKGSPFVVHYEIEKHRRTAIPFATFILTFIGFGVASRKVRGGMGLHLLIGIAISAIYILFLQISMTLATNINFSPFLSVWLPNFLFIIVCIGILYAAPK